MTRCPSCFSPARRQGVCETCGFDPAKVVPGAILTPGTRLAGRYQVGGLLGQGGFGATYRGYDTRLASMVAIKEYFLMGGVTRSAGSLGLTVEASAREAFDFGRSKFLEEALTLAQLRLVSSVVSVYDFFEENGTAYIIMDYLSGLTLKQLLKRRSDHRLPLPRALPLLRDLLEALAQIHQEKILHCDISPDNIFICGNGALKLIDFGAARHATVVKSQELGTFLKPGYAPPEQYSHDLSHQGPWSDLYAVGATFYQVLSGVLPSESTARLARDDLKPLAGLGVEVPPAVDQALLRALALKPRDRWPDAASFAEAMVRAAHGATAGGNGAAGQGGERVARVGYSGDNPPPQGADAPSRSPLLPPLAGEDLRQALIAHARYLGKKNGGRRLNLARRDFSCARLGTINLAEADLSGVVFACADLLGSDFSRANLFCADFAGANLRYARFDHADLRGARFDNADLTGSSLDGADCREGVLFVQSRSQELVQAGTEGTRRVTSFATVNLTRAQLRNADLRSAQFTQALMEKVDLTQANLENANLAGACLRHSVFEGTQLRGCDFAQADLAGVDTSTPVFAGVQLPRQLDEIERSLQDQIADHRKWVDSLTREGERLVLRDCDLSGLVMGRVDWSAAEFFDVALDGIDLAQAILAGTRFSGCSLRGARLGRTDARGIRFVDCDLSQADFTQAQLSPILIPGGRRVISTFADSRLPGARFAGAVCPHADFGGTDLRRADFRNAQLTHADFSGARIDGARWDGAQLAQVVGLAPDGPGLGRQAPAGAL